MGYVLDADNHSQCTAHDEECEPCLNRWRLYLSLNIDMAAALTLQRRMGFATGYDHFQVLRDISDPEIKTNHPVVAGFRPPESLDSRGLSWLVEDY